MSEQSLGAGVEIVRSQNQGSFLEVLWVATRLGLTSFGGPIAHLGYFHEEYVKRRKWIDEQSYADLVALCQFLPGPASSQVSIAIGIARAGLPGGFAAWLGFTLPSALALIAFAVRNRRFCKCCRRRMVAWPEGRCRRGCCSGDLGDGSFSLPGS